MLRELRDNPDVRHQFSKAVDRHLVDADRASEWTNWKKCLTEAIQGAAEQTIPRQLHNEGEWVTPEYRRMLESLGGQLAAKQRRHFNLKINNLRVKPVNEYWEKQARSLNIAAEMGNTEEVFRLAQRKLLPAAVSSIGCPVDSLRQHFSDQFKSRPTPPADPLFDPEVANVLPKAVIDSSAPRLDEIQKVVKRLKSGRCLGIDGVASEHLKYCKTSTLCEIMQELFTSVCEDWECPEEWTKWRLKPLYKNKGSIMDAKMCRGLMISSTVNKVLIMVLIGRIREHYEAAILQFQ